MTALALRLENVSKSYPGVRALDNVSFDCRAGEVHAILGENGSGKSTLMKVASGVLRPDAGTVHINGALLSQSDAGVAAALGLATVYQDDSLVLEMTVAQNLFLATPRGTGRYRDRNARAVTELAKLGLEIPPNALVGDLSPAQRQFIEIVKAVQTAPKVLLLDEPTATLDADGVRKLAGIVRDLTARGTGIIYVSHRLPEILELADRVTILRDGLHCGTFDVEEGLSEQELVRRMVGHEVAETVPRPVTPSARRPVLTVNDLSGDAIHDIALTAHVGEILGIAGAEGNGQHELLRALVGLEAATGLVRCADREVDFRSPRTALLDGVLLLSADRKKDAIFPQLSVQKTMVSSFLRRFSRGGILSESAERALAQDMMRDFGVVAASLEVPISGLSGGNQQKAVLARSFRTGAKAILIDEPTQGVDAGARQEIYQAIRENIADEGTCIINSSDSQELAAICDRVLVMSRGRIVKELSGIELTEENIVASFLTVRDAATTAMTADQTSALGDLKRVLLRGSTIWWVPLLFLAAMIAGVGVYAAWSSPVFLKPINIRHTLLALAPAALVAMAQLNVLLVRGIDVSVGAVMSLTVVAASFMLASTITGPVVALGMITVLGIGALVGLLNGVVIRFGGINAVITTIAMLSIVQGTALIARPVPGGIISQTLIDLLKARVGFLPWSAVLLVALVIVADYWLHWTRGGLEAQATGFREEAARRNGVNVSRVYLRAYLMSGVLASAAGLFLAAQVAVGHPTVGQNFALTSIAAAVLGGASLAGGRGSFTGALLGALFFTLMINALSILGLSAAVGVIASGAMTLMAIFLYSGLSEAEQLLRQLIRPSLAKQRQVAQ